MIIAAILINTVPVAFIHYNLGVIGDIVQNVGNVVFVTVFLIVLVKGIGNKENTP